MSKNKQFYISVKGQRVSVIEEVYREYRRMQRRERYLEERDAVHGKVLYSDMDTYEMTGESMIPDLESDSVDDSVMCHLMSEILHEALETLSCSERELVVMLYFSNNGTGMTQREAAAILEISQPAIKKRHDKIIRKLKDLITFLK